MGLCIVKNKIHPKHFKKEYEDGSIYIGNMKNSMRNGYGIYKMANSI